MNTTYVRILQAIEAFSSEHLQIKKFASDFPSQMPNFGNKNEEYPILFVSPTDSIFNVNTNTFDLKVYCFDIIEKDRSNINTILSDTNQVLNDLLIWLRDGEVAGIDVMENSTALPINNALLDFAAGWEMTLKLEVDTYTLCEIPFNNIPSVSGITSSIVYNRFLTCESLPDCPVIEDLQEQLDNIAISGGTVNINGNIQPVMAPNEFRVSQGGTGVLTFGFGISANTTTSIKIAPITGYIVNNETNPAEPSFTYVNYSGSTNVPVTTLGSGIGSFVLLNSAGQPYFQNTFPTSTERKANIWLGKIAHPTGTITSVINEPDYIVSPMGKINDLFQAINYINDGVYPYANGANLTFNITGGDIHGNGINLHNSNTNPNEISMGPGIQQPFLYRTQTGGTASAGISIIPGSYDNGGVITSVGGGANSSTLQWIFCVPGAGFIVQYGQTVYSTLTNAIAAIGREQFVVFPNLVDNAILIGVLAVNKSATQLNNTAQAQFFRADKFGQIIGAQAGISTSTLQAAYDNSLAPQITTTSALGAFTLKGWDSGTASTFTILNTANTTTFDIKENGGFLASSDGTINGLTVGRGAGNLITNTVLGTNALTVSGGSAIVAIGRNALANGTGSSNVAVGANALSGSTTSTSNVAIGTNASMGNQNGNNTVAIGADAGRYISDGTTLATQTRSSIFIGDTAKSLSQGQVNEIVIGQSATGLGSNSVILGNDSILKTALKGNVLIGTTVDNGVDKLQVSGTTFFNDNVRFSIGSGIRFLGTSQGRISSDGAGGLDFNYSVAGSGHFSWYGGGTTALVTLRNTGNLLIGTTSDNGIDKLQVTGSANISSDSTINGLTVGKGGGNNAINTTIGVQALENNTTNYNTAIGYRTLRATTSGSSNTGLGTNAMTSNILGSSNVAIGRESGAFISDKTTLMTQADQSIFIGSRTSPLSNNQTNQIVFGFNANGIGDNSVVLGNDSITKTALKGNVLIGTTTDNGVDKLQVTGSASFTSDIKVNNLTVGKSAGNQITNTAFGINTLSGNTVGVQNTAIGAQSLAKVTAGSSNTAIGYLSLAVSVGSDNVAVGSQSLAVSTTSFNVGVGSFALRNSVSGSKNVAVGYNALLNNVSQDSSVAVGTEALKSMTIGGNNVAIGVNSLINHSTSTFNTALGYYAGSYVSGATILNTISTNSVYLGTFTQSLMSGQTNEIVIGYQTVGLGSNSVVLGNNNITKTALKGNVVIGTTGDTGQKLQVSGTAKFDQIDLKDTVTTDYKHLTFNANKLRIVNDNLGVTTDITLPLSSTTVAMPSTSGTLALTSQVTNLVDVTITGTSFTINTDNTRYICTSTASTIGVIASGVTGNIEVLRYGTGSVSFSAGTGTTLRYASYVTTSIAEQYATAALTKLVSPGEIRLFGELTSI